MNNFRWTAPFLNMGRRRRFFGLNRANNQGRTGMFLTILGIGAGAMWYGLSQRNNNNGRNPLQNTFSNVQRAMPNTETAFSEELMPNSSRNERD